MNSSKGRERIHDDMRYQQHVHRAWWLWRHVKKVVTFHCLFCIIRTKRKIKNWNEGKFFQSFSFHNFQAIHFLLSKNCSCQLFFFFLLQLRSVCRLHSPYFIHLSFPGKRYDEILLLNWKCFLWIAFFWIWMRKRCNILDRCCKFSRNFCIKLNKIIIFLAAGVVETSEDVQIL